MKNRQRNIEPAEWGHLLRTIISSLCVAQRLFRTAVSFLGPENYFAGGIKIIAVDEGKCGKHGIALIQTVNPQTG